MPRKRRSMKPGHTFARVGRGMSAGGTGRLLTVPTLCRRQSGKMLAQAGLTSARRRTLLSNTVHPNPVLPNGDYAARPDAKRR